MSFKCYEVEVRGEVHTIVTGDVDSACLEFSNELQYPLQPWDFKEAPTLPHLMFWGII